MSDSQTNSQSGVVEFRMLPSGVALISLGGTNEKVVTLTFDRLKSLKEAIKRVKTDRPKGVIITGPSLEMFTVGADINLIRDVTDKSVGEKLAREGQLVFNDVATLDCTTVAAIAGPCVGGGCELALACDVRIITDNKSNLIGLPEIKLGILPGFGGTQRLPRLIGLPKALDIILSGKTLKPKQALACGLVNEVVSGDVLMKRAEAIARGESKARPVRIGFIDTVLTKTGLGRGVVRKKATAKVNKETKGFYPAPIAALDACVYGLEKGMEAGLILEARELGRLIVTPESKSLIKIFFLTEGAKAIGKSAKKSVEAMSAVVIGAGAMGAGIAGVFAKNNLPVILKDTTEDALGRGRSQIKRYIDKMRGLSESEKSFVLNRIEFTTKDSPNISNATLAVEAVFEEIEIKKKILSGVAGLMPADAIVASNTSSLALTEIAASIPQPERVVGMHFFNPVEKMPLVEIVRAKQTSDKTVAIVAALTTKIGKYPIVVNDVPGFLINRILSPYLNEAAYLLVDGFTMSDIDKAALGFGMPMGPIRLLDEIGLDVAVHVQNTMVQGYGERMAGPGLAKTLVEAGRKGKKSGAGFYDFKDNEAVYSPTAASVLRLSQSRIGADLKIIVDRLIMALVNEAVRCLDEGVAGKPGKDAADQIDLGTVMGTGFPPFRGGLISYAESLGAKKISDTLVRLEREVGARFTPCAGIRRRAESSLSFYAS